MKVVNDDLPPLPAPPAPWSQAHVRAQIPEVQELETMQEIFDADSGQLGLAIEAARERQASRADGPIIDRNVLQLLLAEEPELMLETIDRFAGQFPEWLANLSDGLDRHQFARCIEACRMIEEAVGFVAAQPLRHRAAELRGAIASGDLRRAWELHDKLEVDYGRAFNELRDLIQSR